MTTQTCRYCLETIQAGAQKCRYCGSGLLAEAEAAGCTTVDGLGMLLYQAVPGFERWFGQRPTVDAATRAAALR